MLTEKQKTHILNQLEKRAKESVLVSVSLDLTTEEYEALKELLKGDQEQ